MKHLIIIGAGGMGRQLSSSATRCVGYGEVFDIKGFLDYPKDDWDLDHYPPILGLEDNYVIQPDDVFVCSMGDVKKKKECIERILSKGGEFFSLIDKTVTLHPTVKVGKGVIISGNAGIGVDCTLGDFCFIQSGAIVGHDVKIGSYSRIDCRVILVGGVIIGNEVTIHTNSIISHNVVVGDGAKVGAMSFVIRKVKPGVTVQGNPAKVIF